MSAFDGGLARQRSVPSHGRTHVASAVVWEEWGGTCGEVEGGAHRLVGSAGLRPSPMRRPAAGAVPLQSSRVAKVRIW